MFGMLWSQTVIPGGTGAEGDGAEPGIPTWESLSLKPSRNSRFTSGKSRPCPGMTRVGDRVSYTTVLCRSIQVVSTSSIDLLHQFSEKISISE